MIVIPAIDIKDGRCVRLRQGKMSDETIFSDRPEEMAVKWYQKGAERLHLVDLDGAVQGRPVNQKVIKRIVLSVPISVELGGGIRDTATLEAYFELGLHYLILGTGVLKDPQFVENACKRFPGRIILGIDARDNRIAVEGWTEETDLKPLDVVQKFEACGVAAIIYTDIHRDGMGSGPNLEATRALARAVKIPVIVSGGISGIEDVINVSRLANDGIMGMITGRALYDGRLDLAEAVKVVERWKV